MMMMMPIFNHGSIWERLQKLLKIPATWALPSEILIKWVWVGTHITISSKSSSTFRLAPAVGTFHRSTALVASEPTVSGPSGDVGMLVEAGAKGKDDSLGKAEYAAINSMADQINSCLDHLEDKNHHLHVCLQELLESNWQTCLGFQQQLGEFPRDASP
nr:bublin coiled-coil protein-like [Mirounga angustirostris]